jgi:rhamnosyltransferase
MSISLVIRALNEDQHIGRLLAGIERQTIKPDEVILVDSGSTDATVDIASHFGCQVVHITPEDFSFGRSLNLGMHAASGDIVVIPSAHVYPLRNNWIEALISPFESPSVGLSYGRQVGEDRTKYSEHRILANWFPPESNLNQRHPFCNNANAAVRKSVWEEHRYDEFLTGLEDIDFANRIQKQGWQLSYVAEAEVVHVHEESWSQIRNRYRREAIAHRAIFQDQAMTIFETVRLVVANIRNDWKSARDDRMLLTHVQDIVLFRVNQFLGTFKGFRHTGPPSSDLKRLFYYPTQRRTLTQLRSINDQETIIDYSNLEIDVPSDRHNRSD